MTFSQELGRKAIHLASGILPIAYWFLPREIYLPVIAALAAGTVIVDYGRHRVYWIGVAFNAVFGFVLREDENESRSLTGGSTVMISQVIAVAFFPKPIAVASLLVLSVGDTAAALVGRAVGAHKIYGEKTWEGTLAFLIFAGLTASLVPGIPLYAALLAALFAAIVEVFLNSVDDNLFIPIASGLTLFLLLGF